MNRAHRGVEIDFGGPATYRIDVQGRLNPSYSSRLAGLTITTTESGDGVARTTLTGPIRDQAELSGVLDTLYGLHMPILSIQAINGDLDL